MRFFYFAPRMRIELTLTFRGDSLLHSTSPYKTILDSSFLHNTLLYLTGLYIKKCPPRNQTEQRQSARAGLVPNKIVRSVLNFTATILFLLLRIVRIFYDTCRHHIAAQQSQRIAIPLPCQAETHRSKPLPLYSTR